MATGCIFRQSRLIHWSRISLPLLLVLAAGSYGSETRALPEADLHAAISGGKSSLNLRYRFDHFADDARPKDANASTLRTRLGYTTADWSNLRVSLEMDNISSLGETRYFSIVNGKSDYALIPDPSGTDLNQAYLQYDAPFGTTITAGRQKVVFDNERHIGAKGWRQNEQTLDGIRITYAGTDRLQATYAYISFINNIFFERRESDWNRNFRTVAYHYALDLEGRLADSLQTTGLRISGAFNDQGRWQPGYVLEGAHQQAHADNPDDFSVKYLHGEILLKMVPAARDQLAWQLTLGHENMTTDAGTAFQTPMATGKFHGYAEKFSGRIPDGGLKDSYVKSSLSRNAWRLSVAAHDLRSDHGDRYGSEVDVSLFRRIGRHYAALLVYSDYNAEDLFADARRAQLLLMARY